MPDRPGIARYDGPERRTRNRRAVDRPPLKHGWFTTWQWAVLASFVVSVTLSAAVAEIASQADANARSGNAAICVQVAFLENTVKTTEKLIVQSPTDPANPARRDGARDVRRLIVQLQREIPSCRRALR